MNKRILFVDDEPLVLQSLRRRMSAKRAEVGRTPSSAQPALRAHGESRGAIPRTRRPGLHEDSSPTQALEIKFAGGGPEITSWSQNHA